MVGFQTKMKWGEQTRIFKTIPGLEDANFARLGGLHRNTFINSPKLLDGTLQLQSNTRIRFAGQITGCEGYVESASIGLITGRFAASELLGGAADIPPITTAIGALINHITGLSQKKKQQLSTKTKKAKPSAPSSKAKTAKKPTPPAQRET